MSSPRYLGHGEGWEDDQRFTGVLGRYQLFCRYKPKHRSAVCLQWGPAFKICPINHCLFVPLIINELLKRKILCFLQKSCFICCTEIAIFVFYFFCGWVVELGVCASCP